MNYRTILAVINENTGSTVAALYAMALAEASSARLVLYSAFPEGEDETAFHHTTRHLDHLHEVAILHGIEVTRISESGTISRSLPHRALAEGADLVFYPMVPGERYGAAIKSHTAHQLLETIGADLAVMRIMHMGKPHPRHILVPVGKVIREVGAWLRFLSMLARGFQSQITLFHRPETATNGLPGDLLSLRDGLIGQNLPVLERSGAGGIARSIALEAISHHNDLIVVGASERSPLRRLLFGTPAGDVMHHPPCNAILFRPGRRKP